MPPKPSAKNVADAVEKIGKVTYIGLNHVSEKWKDRIVNYGENGLLKKLKDSNTTVKSIRVKTKSGADTPVHQSSYDKTDKDLIVSVEVVTGNGSKKTHHVNEQGKGSAFAKDKKEFHTSAPKKG